MMNQNKRGCKREFCYGNTKSGKRYWIFGEMIAWNPKDYPLHPSNYEQVTGQFPGEI
jgi:hypothetical protein